MREWERGDRCWAVEVGRKDGHTILTPRIYILGLHESKRFLEWEFEDRGDEVRIPNDGEMVGSSLSVTLFRRRFPQYADIRYNLRAAPQHIEWNTSLVLTPFEEAVFRLGGERFYIVCGHKFLQKEGVVAAIGKHYSDRHGCSFVRVLRVLGELKTAQWKTLIVPTEFGYRETRFPPRQGQRVEVRGQQVEVR